MNRLEELLARFQEQVATCEELTELKRLLAAPENRAAVREILHMESALHSAFQAGPVLQALVKKHPARPVADLVASPKAREMETARPWFSWRSFAVAVTIALMALLARSWFWQAGKLPAGNGENVGRTSPEGLRIARMQAFEGEVQVDRSGQRIAAGRGMPMYSGDEIRTAGAASARIQYEGELTWLELAKDSVLELSATTQGKQVTLRQGHFKAEVAPQPPGRPMICRTPQADAVVLGTVFTLAAWSDQTFLNVERGVVRLAQSDGSAEDVKAGQAANAVLGRPVGYVPVLNTEAPAIQRIPQNWILNMGLLDLPLPGSLSFDFERKPRWTLVKGAYWQAPEPPQTGHLVLTGVGRDNNGRYKAVTPYISAGPNEVIRVSGQAKYSNRAKLGLAYYLCDSSPKCFGRLDVNGRATSDSPEFVPFQFEFTLPDYADLRHIALILYCEHADGDNPKSGDKILIDEMQISRGQ